MKWASINEMSMSKWNEHDTVKWEDGVRNQENHTVDAHSGPGTRDGKLTNLVWELEPTAGFSWQGVKTDIGGSTSCHHISGSLCAILGVGGQGGAWRSPAVVHPHAVPRTKVHVQSLQCDMYCSDHRDTDRSSRTMTFSTVWADNHLVWISTNTCHDTAYRLTIHSTKSTL